MRSQGRRIAWRCWSSVWHLEQVGQASSWMFTHPIGFRAYQFFGRWSASRCILCERRWAYSSGEVGSVRVICTHLEKVFLRFSLELFLILWGWMFTSISLPLFLRWPLRCWSISTIIKSVYNYRSYFQVHCSYHSQGHWETGVLHCTWVLFLRMVRWSRSWWSSGGVCWWFELFCRPLWCLLCLYAKEYRYWDHLLR